MGTNFAYRQQQVKTLTHDGGVYVLCDLDEVPMYVGESADIQERVRRHLTSARSDVIANRMIDVWEVAYVWTYPVDGKPEAKRVESALFHHFNKKKPLMTGKIPRVFEDQSFPDPAQKIQVMSDEEIDERKDIAFRLPRQAEHYAQIVSHFLAVKDSTEIAIAMDAHFKRLAEYHQLLLRIAVPDRE